MNLKRLNLFFTFLVIIFYLKAYTSALAQASKGQEHRDQESIARVIFFHPDGMSVSHWSAVRMFTAGPDGKTHWDQMPYLSVYRGHLKDALTATSNAGATSHAYGVNVEASSFGQDGEKRIRSASGFDGSLMHEAQAKGKAIGLVQTGHIAEPGTAAFLARVSKRSDYSDIAKQVIFSQPDVHLSGGEKYMLPKGVQGRFGEGVREDGLNLIEWAKDKNYTIVYTKDELKKINKNTKKLLGVFAADHTFNDETEEDLKRTNKPLYIQSAPTVKEMSEAAVKVLSHNPKGYFLVIEEEATDNFPNKNNAKGFFEAGRRADEALGFLSQYVEKASSTLLLVASDSDAGGLEVYGLDSKKMPANKKLSSGDEKAFVMDGREGQQSPPFLSAPDKRGKKHPFAILWTGQGDVSGGILARAKGYRADLLQKKYGPNIDNTQIFEFMRIVLFDLEN